MKALIISDLGLPPFQGGAWCELNLSDSRTLYC
jgi:hypothetical protein